MCESKVYIKKGESLELIASDIVSLVTRESGLKLIDISGRVYEVDNAVIDYIDFVEHKVVLKKLR